MLRVPKVFSSARLSRIWCHTFAYFPLYISLLYYHFLSPFLSKFWGVHLPRISREGCVNTPLLGFIVPKGIQIQSKDLFVKADFYRDLINMILVPEISVFVHHTAQFEVLLSIRPVGEYCVHRRLLTKR